MDFNVAELFEAVAAAVPDREALVCRGADGLEIRRSYAALDERANRLANALAERGIGPGDHIGLQLHNSQEYVEGMVAAFKLRAVPVNVNHRYVAAELAYLFNDARLKAVIVEPDLVDRVEAVAPDLPLLRTRLVRGDEYEAALRATAPTAPDVGARTGDDLYVLYTGGTTGMPKGVMWRQEDWFFACLGGREGQAADEVVERARKGSSLARRLPLCPLMHGAAQWVVWQTFLAGDTCVLSVDHHFDPAAALDVLADEKVALTMVVGDAVARPLADAIRSDPTRWDLSALRILSSGGAILSPTVGDELSSLLPGTKINNTFGASETGGQGRFVPSGPGGAPRLQTDGSTLVVDDDFAPVPAGSDVVGRLARRGRIPLGYFGDEEKTRATFPVVDGVRWSVPGDMAMVDPDGGIILLGRGAASINTGGEKVFPEEVEGVLKSHPDVFDAYVVGVPDERFGERVTAVLAWRPGVVEPSIEAVTEYCHTQLSGYKVPRAVVVVDHLQRLLTGKADYKWAKEVATAHALG